MTDPTPPPDGITPRPPAPPPLPPPHAAGGYPAAPAPRTSSNAVVALVLAVAAWAVCPIVPAVAALPVASSAQREIDASAGWVVGGGLVTAARVVAWANIAVFGLVILGLLAVLVGAAVGGSR